MNLLPSTLLGIKGESNLFGIKIRFNDENSGDNVFGDTLFSKVTNCLLGNSVVKLATFGYLHVFIHEMGHVLAAKLCGKCKPTINIYTKTCRGSAENLSTSNFFISIAGPALGMIWELAKLTAAIALIILLPTVIGLPLGIFLGIGSAFWLFGELAYACSRNGDWSFLRHS